jgi:hypothetical protein
MAAATPMLWCCCSSYLFWYYLYSKENLVSAALYSKENLVSAALSSHDGLGGNGTDGLLLLCRQLWGDDVL